MAFSNSVYFFICIILLSALDPFILSVVGPHQYKLSSSKTSKLVSYLPLTPLPSGRAPYGVFTELSQFFIVTLTDDI